MLSCHDRYPVAPVNAFTGAFARSLLATIAFSLAVLSPVSAGTLNGLGNDADAGNNTGIQAVNDPTLFVGGAPDSGNGTDYRVSVFVFQLPTLSTGQAFTNADFNTYLTGVDDFGGNAAHIDLYGLTARTSPSVLAHDYFAGPDDLAATRLQTNFTVDTISSGAAVGPETTNAGGSLLLTDYLNAQFDGGAGAGKYVFLRLNLDANPEGTGFFKYVKYASANASDSTQRPFITYQLGSASAPEPGAGNFLFLGVAVAPGIYLRKRKPR